MAALVYAIIAGETSACAGARLVEAKSLVNHFETLVISAPSRSQDRIKVRFIWAIARSAKTTAKCDVIALYTRSI